MLSEQFEQLLIEISVSIVEAPLALFEMQVKGMTWHTVELLQSAFSKAPKALNTIDVPTARSKLISAMIDAKVLGITHIHQTVVAAPASAVNSGLWGDTTANNGLQRGFFAVWHDLGINLALSLQDAKDWCLARCARTSLATHATSAKVAFVHFDFAAGKRRLALTLLGDAASNFEVNAVHGFGGQAGQGCRVSGAQVARETVRQLTKFLLRDSGTPVILVLPCHIRSFSHFALA